MTGHADTDDRQPNDLSDAETPTVQEHDSSAVEEDQGHADAGGTDTLAGREAELVAEKQSSPLRSAIAVGAAIVVALGSLAGWFGYHTYEDRQELAQRNQWIAVARQGALNLTTIDYTEVDADVRRILDSSTGAFRDDFQKRSQPFIDVVKKAQSKSQGTIIEAGLESQDGDQAQVLVAVSVKTSNSGAQEQDPRRWRMRINVQRVGDTGKVSNVEFVP